MKNISRYSGDEVMIFSGELADGLIGLILNLGSPLYGSDMVEEVRNIAAAAAEEVISGWTGAATVPLPRELHMMMFQAAQKAAVMFTLHEAGLMPAMIDVHEQLKAA